MHNPTEIDDLEADIERLGQSLAKPVCRPMPPQVVVCYQCAKEWSRPGNSFALYCPPCNERLLSEKAAKEAARREVDWLRLCPESYRTSDPARIPSQAAMYRVQAWEYNAKGLLLHGKTRRGKSRCAWMLIKRLFNEGRSIVAMDSLCGFSYGASFGSGTGARSVNAGMARAEEWVRERTECEVLFMDDVFKVKLTDSFESVLFGIIERRAANGLPCIITSNDTGATLVSRMSADRGEPLIERLREHCEGIAFE